MKVIPKIKLFLEKRPIAWGNLVVVTIAGQIGVFVYAYLSEQSVPYFEIILLNIVACLILIVLGWVLWIPDEE